ncbi:hypothetical protein [Pedobacter sp. CFBP9032]|uniref:hypothetical protein n=1 Tax=Pedobacter sp. CFBP9032 TaxID=3096539 RepID=UPI002A6B6A3E|nr:hypothetical protein [Pedobacter sp. CFBP9032]MDY0903802.1 hypothetical protein [Pedobacter sp. CFBP9032]
MKWKEKLLIDLISSASALEIPQSILDDIANASVNVHLAIFSEPFVSLLFSGDKTIESRFSVNKITPYGKVLPNDIVLIKNSGGDICGLFRVSLVNYYSNLKIEKISELNANWGKQIQWDKDPDFLNQKKSAKFLTLLWISELVAFSGIKSEKKDRTSWVVIRSTLNGTLFS